MTTGIERLKTICGALHPGGIVRMPHERLRGIIEQIERETVPTPEWPDDSGLPEGMRVLAVLVWRDGGDHSEVHLTKQNYDWFCWLHEHGGPERIEKRLMPKGMEWPRYEDGELVVIGGAVASEPFPNIAIAVEAIEFTDGCAHVKDGEGDDWSTSIEVRPGRRVKRPASLAADGDPLEPGQTVWGIGRSQHEFEVLALNDVNPEVGGRFDVKCFDKDENEECWCDPNLLIHQRPVLDAEGNLIEPAMDVWWICEGDERGIHAEKLHVESIGEDGFVTCDPVNGGTWVELEPSELYVHKPVLDADGVPVHEGDTVWLEYDEVHGCNICTGCGERYKHGMYMAVTYDDFIAYKPMRYCPACGARLEGVGR